MLCLLILKEAKEKEGIDELLFPVEGLPFCSWKIHQENFLNFLEKLVKDSNSLAGMNDEIKFEKS